ncbi:MAG: ribose-phosphate pyrophosphokinase [Atopococcus tabaci]|uniref:Ribose-phosphate pyrophosphokinase n=1 Tax=Atopococcus tabaci TaxID=269774 RepID=A0AA43UBZ0_9LACT|nr:ribose-phosphate pyrophosphokinase [Atopococcus tabaci]
MEKKVTFEKTKDNIRLFSLNSNLPLAEKIARNLDLPLGEVAIKNFSDGEIAINIEESIRGKDIYLVQSTSHQINDYYMEIFVMADALRRASANSINLVIPYYGYARQDRKAKSREPITAKLVANLMSRCGVDHVIAVDLHSPQIQGFFDIPTDHFTAQPVLANYFEKNYLEDKNQAVVVAPNHSAANFGRVYAEILDLPLAIIDDREDEEGNKALHPIGEVDKCQCIIVDDLTDTGSTIAQVSDVLMENGASEVYALVTHPVLSGDASDKIMQSSLKKLVSTDSIQLSENQVNEKIEQISISHLLADGIVRVHERKTTGPLFKQEYMRGFED